MYNYFQKGGDLVVVPDNLRTGVAKHTRTTLKINETYDSMENCYHAIILPARVRKPKDKTAVENTVKSLSTQTIARMHNSIERYKKKASLTHKNANLSDISCTPTEDYVRKTSNS